jgi:hypothetical protein
VLPTYNRRHRQWAVEVPNDPSRIDGPWEVPRVVESGLCRGDRRLSIAKIKVGDVACVIEIHCEQGMGLDVPQKIRAEHYSMTDFALDAEVHLHRARAEIVGIEQPLVIAVRVYVCTCVQKAADVAWIGVRHAERIGGLKCLLERHHGDGIADGIRAGSCRSFTQSELRRIRPQTSCAVLTRFRNLQERAIL